MWFSDKNNNSVNFIKIKWLKKEEKIHYWENNGEPIENNNFSWKLIKVNPSEYEYEWKMRQTIKMLFVDEATEYFQLDISYNSLSRWLINTLLWYIDSNKDKIKWRINLDLSLYINKANYKQMWIQINWERWNWKYDIEEQKSMIEIIKNKAGEFVSSDYSVYDNRLKEWLITINDFITVDDFVEEPKVESNEELNAEDIF